MIERASRPVELVRSFTHALKEREVQPPVHFYDLTDRNIEAEERLKEQVERSGGEAAVLVHPYFVGEWGREYPLTKTYKNELESFITDISSSHVPLIIFEETNQIRSLAKKMTPLIEEAFLIRTIADNPAPDSMFITERDKQFLEMEYHEFLIDTSISKNFVNVGVRNVHIGGRMFFRGDVPKSTPPYSISSRFLDTAAYLDTGKEWVTNRQYPKGCVGGVIQGLFRQGIETHVHTSAHPSCIRNTGAEPDYEDRELLP